MSADVQSLPLYSETKWTSNICHCQLSHKWLVMGLKMDQCVIRVCPCHCALSYLIFYVIYHLIPSMHLYHHSATSVRRCFINARFLYLHVPLVPCVPLPPHKCFTCHMCFMFHMCLMCHMCFLCYKCFKCYTLGCFRKTLFPKKNKATPPRTPLGYI